MTVRSVLSNGLIDGCLGRPRMRLQSPTIAFKPTAILQQSREEGRAKLKDPFLPSCVPASMNLLESLKNDPAAPGAGPMLLAARLSRISPLSNDEGNTDCALKASTPQVFRALPAVSTRIRYSRANGRGGKPSIIASLDIETAPFSSEDLNLTAIDMELSDGTAVYLGKALAPILPLNCRPKDNPVFLFRLTPQETPSDGSYQTSAKTLLITVHATVLISTSCQPRIEMRWKTGVDFSTALNPTYGAPGQSMQRPRRPSSLSRPPSTTNLTSLPSTAREGNSTPESIRTRQRAVSISDFGVSITFTGPKIVKVGRPFSWKVLILNCSSKPRQLSLTVMTKQKQGSAAGHQSRTSNSSTSRYRDLNTAGAVIDENVLYALQRNLGVDAAQVISLSTDVRIEYVALYAHPCVSLTSTERTLNPDSCVNSELKLLPLTSGYLQVEAVRVTDVASNESIDIRSLPDILAEDDPLET